MTEKTLKEFLEVMKNEDMREAYTAFLKERKPENKEEEIRAMVEFAARKGYEITAEQLSVENASKRELPDEELDNAAGGNWCWSDYSCFLLNAKDSCNAIMENCTSAQTIDDCFGTYQRSN